MFGESDLADLARNWTPPADLRGSPPRSVRLTGGGIALILLAIGLVAGGILLGIWMRQEFTRKTETRGLLEEQGRETDATVTRLWRGSGKDQPHRVSYRFSAAAQIFDGQATAPRRIWEGLAEGSRLRVRYAASDPKINHPAEWESEVPPQWIAWLLPATFSGIALFIAWSLRRQKRLLEDGRVAQGVITRVRRVKGGRKIHYDFLLPGGVKAAGRGMGRQGLIDVGSSVTVIYDPDDPKRNAPYPFDLVRPAE